MSPRRSEIAVEPAVDDVGPVPVARQQLPQQIAIEDLERFPDLVLDTSHAAVSNLDIREFYRTYRDRIRHWTGISGQRLENIENLLA